MARITADEVVAIAARTARKLNLPWGPDVRVTRPLLWPIGDAWRVVSRVPEELAETTLLVHERTRTAEPRRVRHRREFGAPR